MNSLLLSASSRTLEILAVPPVPKKQPEPAAEIAPAKSSEAVESRTSQPQPTAKA